MNYYCFFFFQAEDGIRDKLVTGVQTCALPIVRRLARAQAVDRLLQQLLLLESLAQAEIDAVDPLLELGEAGTVLHVAELSGQLVDGLAKQPEVAIARRFGFDVVE